MLCKREESHSCENVLKLDMHNMQIASCISHTNGRDEGNEWKQVDWDEQGGDQSVPVHQKRITFLLFWNSQVNK